MPSIRPIVPRKKRTYWAQTDAGRAHAAKSMSAWNATPGGVAHRLAQAKRMASDPVLKLWRQLRSSESCAVVAEYRGNAARAAHHWGRVEECRAELARIGGLK